MRIHLRITALSTFVCFLGTSLVGPAPRAYSEGAPGIEAPVVDSEHLNIPAEFGSIRERVPTSEKNKPLVIYIQDAHAVYDAQKSIQGIIQHLQKQYLLPLVAVEGAVGELDPVLFRAFPVASIKEKVFDELMHRGEISGVDASAILNSAWSDFVGIEDKALYFEDRDAFIDALKKKDSAIKVLDEKAENNRVKKANRYSEELLKLDEKYEAFQSDPKQLFELLTWLAKYPVPESRFPKLSLLLKEVSQESKSEEHEKEQQNVPVMKFAGKVKAQLRGAELKEYGTLYQAFQTKGERGAFVEFLWKKAQEKGLDAGTFEAVVQRERKEAKLRNTGGEEVYRELESFIGEKKESLFRTPVERELDQEAHGLKLFRKLISLELTREELVELKQSFHLDFALAAPASAETTPRNELTPFLAPAIRFYRLALERDKVLFQKLVDEIRKNKAPFVAVVTGGFHAEGVKALLKEKGYPYVLVAPKIREVGQSPYLDVMLGKNLSYASYLNSGKSPETSEIALIGLLSKLDPLKFNAFRSSTSNTLVRNAVGTDQPLEPLKQNWHNGAVKGHLENETPSKDDIELIAQLLPALPKPEGEKAQADRIGQIVQALKGVLDLKNKELSGDKIRAAVNEFLDRLSQSGPSPEEITAHALEVFGYHPPAPTSKPVFPEFVSAEQAIQGFHDELARTSQSPTTLTEEAAQKILNSPGARSVIRNTLDALKAQERFANREIRMVESTEATTNVLRSQFTKAASLAGENLENYPPGVQSTILRRILEKLPEAELVNKMPVNSYVASGAASATSQLTSALTQTESSMPPPHTTPKHLPTQLLPSSLPSLGLQGNDNPGKKGSQAQTYTKPQNGVNNYLTINQSGNPGIPARAEVRVTESTASRVQGTAQYARPSTHDKSSPRAEVRADHTSSIEELRESLEPLPPGMEVSVPAIVADESRKKT